MDAPVTSEVSHHAPSPAGRPVTAQLLIGPLLRRVVGDRATIWVETTEPAVVRVRADGGAAGRADTFTAFGHHYAMVVVENLAPDTDSAYEVLLNDRPVWPPADWPYPPSVIRTRAVDDAAQPVRLIFGSCREATQHATGRRLPPDALDAYARRLMAEPDEAQQRPDLLVLLGDQVYADETSKKIRRYLRRRRAGRRVDAPNGQVVSFDEYTKLYLESWRDPEVRWLLSTVPSVMIFDDHEIIDDWNSSASWRADMAEASWWAQRIASGLASYWIYQHLGNLSPDEIAADAVYTRINAGDDASELLRAFGAAVDDPASAGNTVRPYQWSYALDLGRTRLVVLDNRCSRVLEPGRRAMLPPGEWQWFVDQAHGDYDHLVIGSSLPWLMPPAIHHIEAWNEKLADSPSPRVSGFAEGVRRTFDLEHWAAFGRSFNDLAELFRRLGAGGDSAPGHRIGAGGAYAGPATISVLSGDVHHSYVARADLGADVRTPVHQLTCSPIHNQVPAPMRPLMRFGWSRAAARAMRGLARSAGLQRPALSWRRLAGPYFGNAVGTLRHQGATAQVTIEGTTKDGHLRTVAAVDLHRQ
jgi:hypothetical protein